VERGHNLCVSSPSAPIFGSYMYDRIMACEPPEMAIRTQFHLNYDPFGVFLAYQIIT
jgi:hypothetical protein